MRSSVQSNIALCAFLIVLPTIGGCFSYRQAQGTPQPSKPMPADAWPVFEIVEVEKLVDTPKVIERSTIDLDRLRSPWKEMGQRGVEIVQSWLTDDLLYTNLDTHGLIRVWKDRRAGDLNPVKLDDGKARVSDFDQNASYLIDPIALREVEYERIKQEIGGQQPSRSFISIFYGFEPTEIEERWQLNHGLSMAVPEIIPENPRGLIIHITGLMETKYEHRLTNRLRSFGYASAYLESDIFLTGPNSHQRRVRIAERNKWIKDHQDQTQREKAEIDLADENIKQAEAQVRKASDAYFESLKDLFVQVDKTLPHIEDGFQIHPDTDIETLASIIAHAADEKIAEHAYAVEALVRASDHLHPELSAKPIVVLGYSAGAIVSPAAVARLKLVFPDRPIRLILIGGGGDLLTAATNSSYGSSLLRLKPKSGPEPTTDQIKELIEAYTNTVRLDPLLIAPSIRDIPTLHIYANKDAAVPTAVANMFNAAHGHVDELRHRGNHGTLFYFAAGQAGKIRSWLNTQSEE